MTSSKSFDRRRSLLTQIGTWIVICVLAGLAAMIAREVLEARNIRTGFGFLSYPASFDLSESLLSFSGTDSNARALLVGFLNTVKAALSCIILATLVGVAIGLARLSSNPLLFRLAGAFIELARNVPPLLQLFAWYAIIQVSLPPPAGALRPLPGMALTNRGLWLPALELDGSPAGFLAMTLLPGAVVFVLTRHTSMTRRLTACAGAVALGLLAAAMLDIGTLTLDLPERRGFNFRGGLALSPEFAALVISLSLYTSGFIAEIVRGAVLAVPPGQKEAATALGLRPLGRLRLVVVPQALRAAIPPLTSQYINVTKSTSLAVAIGYSDIVSVGNTVMNQTGRAVEVILIFVVAYMVLTLLIAAVMNALNARSALVTR